MLPVNDLGVMNILCWFCNALHWLDECVSSSRGGHPDFGTCCAHGKVMLPPLWVPLTPLYNLLMANTSQSKEFWLNIVQYNAALAFTSLGVKVDDSVIGHGPPVFRIHGELWHLSGSLLPEDTAHPCYLQLYIYDPHTAYQYWMSRNDNLSLNTMQILQHVMSDYNAYAPIYRHAYEVLWLYNAPDYTVKLSVVPGHDLRCYNLPTADEVGVILPGENVFEGNRHDIVIHLWPQHYHNPDNDHDHLQLRCISEGHAAYTPLHYVLLFPFGEPGWYFEQRVLNNLRRITLLQHTAYHIHPQLNEFSTILCRCR